MSWKCKELIYKLKSPVHIGKGQKLGIIDRTRYYIPGKTMWGAAVAKIGKEKNLSDNKDWERLKEFVKENMIFTYFYICDKKDSETLIPKYGEDRLRYGEKPFSEQGFENKYVTSFASAGVKKDSGTASDGDLHETELIKDKTDPNQPVFIRGYVFINEDGFEKDDRYDSEEFLSHIKGLQVGGERNYGYGKITIDESPTEENKIFDKYEIALNEEKPKIKLDENNESDDETIYALSHLKIKDVDGNSHLGKIESIKGDLEPLVGREYNEKGEGQDANYGGIGLVPGSEFKLNSFKVEEGTKMTPDDYPRNIFIGNFGVWEFEK